MYSGIDIKKKLINFFLHWTNSLGINHLFCDPVLIYCWKLDSSHSIVSCLQSFKSFMNLTCLDFMCLIWNLCPNYGLNVSSSNRLHSFIFFKYFHTADMLARYVTLGEADVQP